MLKQQPVFSITTCFQQSALALAIATMGCAVPVCIGAMLLSAPMTASAATATPSVPGSVTVSAITASGFTVSWTASSETGGKIASYQVWVGNTAHTVAASATSYAVTGLNAATSYNVVVRAADTSHDFSALSSVVAVKTTGTADTTPPTTPGVPAVSNVSATGFTASWTASTDNVGVVGYEVWFGDTVAKVSGSTTHHVFTGLTDGAAANLSVRAFDAAGNFSALTAPVSVQLTRSDTEAPTAPGALSFTNVSSQGFTVNWGASTDNVGVTAYQVWVGNKAYTVAASATDYSVTGLGAIPSVNIGVRARDAAGNWSAITVAKVPTGSTAPTVPTGVTASAVNTNVILSWTASTDSTAVTGYQITRTGGTQGTTVLTSTANSYTDTGLSAQTAYVYTIKAYDAAGNYSTASQSVSVTTGATSDVPAVLTTAVRTIGYSVGTTDVVFVFDEAQQQDVLTSASVTDLTGITLEGSFTEWSNKSLNFTKSATDTGIWYLTVPLANIAAPGNSGQPEFKFVVSGTVSGTAASTAWLNVSSTTPAGYYCGGNHVVLYAGDDPATMIADNTYDATAKPLADFDLSLAADQAAISNFRLVPGSSKLYRSYHPYKKSLPTLDTEDARIAQVKSDIESNGIQTIVTLSGDEAPDTTDTDTAKIESISPYVQNIINTNHDLFLNITYDNVYYESNTAAFGATMKSVVEYIINSANEAPVLVHCRLGNDRTGVVSAMLAAMLGASWTDISADYVSSNNMYVQNYRDPKLLRYAFEHMLNVKVDGDGVDLQTAVDNYFVNGGYLTSAEISSLVSKLK